MVAKIVLKPIPSKYWVRIIWKNVGDDDDVKKKHEFCCGEVFFLLTTSLVDDPISNI
jgi:hypothetical protein